MAVGSVGLFLWLCMISAGQCIMVCPKCVHLQLVTVFPKVPFWDNAFAKRNDTTCKDLDALHVWKELCNDTALPGDKEFRCGYTHGEITGIAPGVEGFKVNVTSRKCLVVTKGNKNGCYDDDDSTQAENWVKFIPQASNVEFRGRTCTCGGYLCDAEPCAYNYYNVPYVGKYGRCVQFYVLLGVGGGGALIIVVVVFIACFCCNRAQTKRLTNPQQSTLKGKSKTYVAETNNFPDLPPHYVGSIDRYQFGNSGRGSDQRLMQSL